MGRRVYFIRPVGMQGPIKIGCSASPDFRRSSLENWSPFALEIIAQIEGGFSLERRFHALFRSTHERREWFSWSPQMDEVVAAIEAGTFDIESLPEPLYIQGCRKGEKVNRTELQRRQFSFSQREWRTSSKSGFRCPVNVQDIALRNDPEEIAAAERYFAEPHIYGKPIGAAWAERRQATFLAKLAVAPSTPLTVSGVG